MPLNRRAAPRPRLVALVALAAVASLVVVVHPSAAPAAVLGSPAGTTATTFEADLGTGWRAGVGTRLTHRESGRYVDLRLLGWAPVAPERDAGGVTYRVAEGFEVSYEATTRSVKELAVLDRRDVSELAFTVRAPGLAAKQVGQEVLLAVDGPGELFLIPAPVAWDADGAAVPVTASLDANVLRLTIDEAALASAPLPITVDPTIEGIARGETEGPQARMLQRTEDGRLVFFHVQGAFGEEHLVYQVSSDGGASWGDPETVTTEPGNLYAPAAQPTPDGGFVVAYARLEGAVGDPNRVAVVELAPDGQDGWLPGPEHLLADDVGASNVPLPTVAVVEDESGPTWAVGYDRHDAVLDGNELVVARSGDAGATWQQSSCQPPLGLTKGVVVAQGDRLHCILRRDVDGLTWREWTDVGWGPPQSIGAGSGVVILPSTTVDDAGTLHLVVADSWQQNAPLTHVSLAADATSWSAPIAVGTGQEPVIAAAGSTLHVFASSDVLVDEVQIVHYVATDGGAFAAAGTFGGRYFDHVLDYTDGWAFEPLGSDAVFALSDAEGVVGNGLSFASEPYRLDRAGSGIAFSFVAPRTTAVTGVAVWYTSADLPPYRIGLQADDGNGAPDGVWLSDERLDADAVLDLVAGTVAPANAPDPSLRGWDIAPTPVTAGTRYHVVIEPADDPLGVSGPTAERWMEVWASRAQGEADGRVHVNGGGGWMVAAGQAPAFRVFDATGAVVDETVVQDTFVEANEYAVTGEAFSPPRALQPQTISMYLRRRGDPQGPVTLRLIDEATDETLWSHTGEPTSTGWFDGPVAGPLGLTPDRRYVLAVDHPVRDADDFWFVPGVGERTGDQAGTWGGAAASLVMAYDRPGLNDRTQEATDLDGSFYRRTALFNGGDNDALYVGAAAPFDFATLTRALSDGGNDVDTMLSYWDGTAWSPVAPEVNQLALDSFDTRSGTTRLAAPSDWQPATLDDHPSAYWLRGTRDPAAPETGPVLVQRITGIDYNLWPTTVTSVPAGSVLPVAWTRNDADGGVVLGEVPPLG